MVKKKLIQIPNSHRPLPRNYTGIMPIWVELSNTYSNSFKFEHARFMRKDMPFIDFYEYLVQYNG